MKSFFNIALLILLMTCAGCGGASVAGDDGGDTPTDNGIRFDISDAVAVLKVNDVATSAATGQTNSFSGNGNLRKLTTGGQVVNLFSSGSINVSSFYAAPDGTLYLILSEPVFVDDSRCILLKLTDDNEYECLDGELQSVKSFTEYPTDPIQFDDAGNVYYMGITTGAEEVLRMIDAETHEVSEIINSNITVRQFLVHGNGMVYLSGMTNSTDTNFFRRLLPDGSLETLMTEVAVVSLFDMPDGNVYAGEWGSVYGIMKVLDDGISGTRHIGYSNINGQPVPAEFYVDDNAFDTCADGAREDYEDFCAMGGTSISSYYQTPNDKYFVVAGSGDGASLWQYWPTVKPVDNSVYRPTIVAGVESSLIIAGYDQSYLNKLIMYDTADESEMDLLAGEDIEIYHFIYSPTSETIFFDGLRFSDNNYVVGSIDLSDNNRMTVLDSGTTYDDMQVLN